MKRFAKVIVKHRVLVLVLAVLLLIPSFIGVAGTYINYDILSYLPDNLESVRGENVLDEDFKMAGTAMITVENMTNSDVLKLKSDIQEIDGVNKVLWTDDIADLSIPKEMFPKDIQKMFYSDDGDATLIIVTFHDTSSSKRTMDAIEGIKGVLKKDCFLGGMSAITEDTKELCESEVPIYVLIAVLLLLVVLFLGMESTIIPFIFLIGIGFAIAYNMGSNIFLGQISFITKSLAMVLQLGVTMDFSIFLLHRYDEEMQNGNSSEDAMVLAIQKTFSSITGSSLTTIAGFLAMCTMTLTLGFDIGMVMAKGVLLGVISTVTILPALIMVFDKPIHRFKHRTFIPKLKKLSQFVPKHYGVILTVFIVLLIPFIWGQTNVKQYYNILDTLPDDLISVQGTDKMKDEFNMTSTHFILTDAELSADQMNSITSQIENLDGVEMALSLNKYVGGSIPNEILPDELIDMVQNGGYQLMLVNSSYSPATDEQNVQLDKIDEIIKKYDPNSMVSGEAALTKDLIKVADNDFKNVNVTSILAVFVIIAIVFKSISLPIILVAAIESAITINMGVPFFTNTTLPFIAGIVVGTIQLGATIDYAILMTNRFREERINGHSAKESAQLAIENCSQSILSSGLAFFGATIGVSLVSKMELINSLCTLISRGAIISMLVILVVLPAILIVCSKLIEKTSWKWLDK